VSNLFILFYFMYLFSICFPMLRALGLVAVAVLAQYIISPNMIWENFSQLAIAVWPNSTEDSGKAADSTVFRNPADPPEWQPDQVD
jgi:hypothetical protein